MFKIIAFFSYFNVCEKTEKVICYYRSISGSKKLSAPLELHRNRALRMFLLHFDILINKKVVKSFQNGRNSKNAL